MNIETKNNIKNEKEKLKKIKQELKKSYKIELKKNKEKIKDIKQIKDLSVEDKKVKIKQTKENLKKIKKENKETIRKQNEIYASCYPNKITQKIYTNYKLNIFISIIVSLVIAFVILGLFAYKKNNDPNYYNGYFSFRYNNEILHIEDFTGTANMWIVSTGGGVESPTFILIGHTSDGKDINVEQPLKNMQNLLSGEISNLDEKTKDDFAYSNYYLTIDDLKYKISSKSYKKDNSILTIMYVNAGNEKEEYQDYLHQVYRTIKLIN